MSMKRYRESYKLWKRAHAVLLNGVSTLSKSPQYITFGASPVFIDRAKGAYVWDCDGNRYIDYLMALGPIILGFAYEEVDREVRKQMRKGSLFRLSNKLELKLDEQL